MIDEIQFFLDNASFDRALIAWSSFVILVSALAVMALLIVDLVQHRQRQGAAYENALALSLALFMGWAAVTFGHAGWWWVTWGFPLDPTAAFSWERFVGAVASLAILALVIVGRSRERPLP